LTESVHSTPSASLLMSRAILLIFAANLASGNGDGEIGDICYSHYDCLSGKCRGNFYPKRCKVCPPFKHCNARTGWCDDTGTCRDKLLSGGDCSHDSQCQSDICQDGKCQECAGNYVECVDELDGSDGYCLNGVCRPLRAHYWPCDYDIMCASEPCTYGRCRTPTPYDSVGVLCDGGPQWLDTTGVCRDPLPMGGDCSHDINCEVDFECNVVRCDDIFTVFGPGPEPEKCPKCTKKRIESNCDSDEECLSNLCEDGRCRHCGPRMGEEWHGLLNCNVGKWCDDYQGRCRDKLPFAAVCNGDKQCITEECTNGQCTKCVTYSTCNGDGWCDETGECRDKKASGASCTDHNECESDSCSLLGKCQDCRFLELFSTCNGDGWCDATGECRDKKASGASCIVNNECQSGNCGWVWGRRKCRD